MENIKQLPNPNENSGSSQSYILATAFLSLFAIVGFAYYGIPFFYDFMTKEFGWSRAVVTSGNAVGKLIGRMDD
jgi:ABC-type multidrug transport system permease subunit